MSQPLRKLIQAITPNFSLKELRQMVPWFDAVSDGINKNGVLVAAAHVDGAGGFQKRFGFNTPVVHGSTGNYRLTYTVTQDVNRLIPMAVLTNQGTPAGAITPYPNLLDGDTIDVNIWQIAATTAVRSQVDHEFFLMVTRLPDDTT